MFVVFKVNACYPSLCFSMPAKCCFVFSFNPKHLIFIENKHIGSNN